MSSGIFQKGISSLDGRGRLLFFDHFGDGINAWQINFGGTGAAAPAINAANSFAYKAPNSVELKCGTTLNSQSSIIRLQSLSRASKVGVEIAFIAQQNMCDYLFNFDYKPIDINGIALPAFAAVFKWTRAGNFQIQISGGTFQTIYAAGAAPANYFLQQIKFVADFNQGKYIRAFIGQYQIDISSYSMALSSLVSYPGLAWHMCQAISYGPGTLNGVIGYSLLTYDEP